MADNNSSDGLGDCLFHPFTWLILYLVFKGVVWLYQAVGDWGRWLWAQFA